MAKKNPPSYRRPVPARPDREEPVPSSLRVVAVRETIESIVVAFVLAFLFRTFEAEAFVIPTGSMSPSLQGQHKDVVCSECGCRFRTTASTEGEDRDAAVAELRQRSLTLQQRQNLQWQIAGAEVIGGMCPMCRQTMLFRTDGLPGGLPESISTVGVKDVSSYPGDRILVNKYAFGYHDPQRWDVVVFKFPGNGEMNYIKRLVGLPGEMLQVYQGDIFIRSNEPGSEYRIERKPPHKIHTMLQSVYDTKYEPTLLHQAGWPLRWSDTATEGWQVEATPEGKQVRQVYKFVSADKADASTQVSWLRYRHLLPDDRDWTVARRYAATGKFTGISQEDWLKEVRPQLITDFNSYNARILRSQVMDGRGPMQVEPYQQGMQWVSDLGIACDVDIDEAQGELLLDVVEAGRHFTCTIDLRTGEASLQIDALPDFTAHAMTSLAKPGAYRLQFANVDDQLVLWVNDQLVSFGDGSGAAVYDADAVFGDREKAIPQTSEEDPGDLAPVALGARGASLVVTRLQVLRDIYYISAQAGDDASPARWSSGGYFTDFDRPDQSTTTPDGTQLSALSYERQIFRDPATWPRFLTRHQREFPIEEGQYFVMGDNSPESLDCRLWKRGNRRTEVPGGAYLDQRLMIGEAVCVFWPHSWGSIPGLKMLPGFPNFWDMRVVR
jgi:signal peptidase I